MGSSDKPAIHDASLPYGTGSIRRHR
jgi:hypothetical protein